MSGLELTFRKRALVLGLPASVIDKLVKTISDYPAPRMLLSYTNAATILGVSWDAIQMMVQNGELRIVNRQDLLGKKQRKRVIAASLDKWVERNAIQYSSTDLQRAIDGKV